MFTMIDIDRVLANDSQSKATIGLSKKEFEYILPTFTQVLLDQDPYYAGRSHTLKEAKHKLFFMLHYLKTYPTFEVIALQYDSFKQRAHTWLQEIKPCFLETLDRLNVLPKRKSSSREDLIGVFDGIKDIFIDATEREIKRPQKDKSQRKHYSGKQKDHTKKTLQSVVKS